MGTQIQWEDPPPSARGARAVQSVTFADALRENPNKWARWSTMYTQPASAYQMANRIKSGIGEAWQPAGAFEAAVRTNGGETTLFVRYVGGVA